MTSLTALELATLSSIETSSSNAIIDLVEAVISRIEEQDEKIQMLEEEVKQLKEEKF